MFAVIGATGNVGYSTSSALRRAGAPVRAILRDAAKETRLKEIGCEIAVANLQDPGSLARAICDAEAVQVVIPVSPSSEDPAEDLRRSVEGVIAAIDQVKPKLILAISDYGAQVSGDIGMPSVFGSFETKLRGLGGHKIILRSAEHMHNWGRVIPTALASGIMPSFQDPVEMEQPTIAAQDLGVISAQLLLQTDNGSDVTLVHAEGPRRYSANDVAAVLSELSGRTVHAEAVPRTQWPEAFARMPSSLAGLLIKANDAKNKGGLVDVEPNAGKVIYGTTKLIDALRPLIPRS